MIIHNPCSSKGLHHLALEVSEVDRVRSATGSMSKPDEHKKSPGDRPRGIIGSVLGIPCVHQNIREQVEIFQKNFHEKVIDLFPIFLVFFPEGDVFFSHSQKAKIRIFLRFDHCPIPLRKEVFRGSGHPLMDSILDQLVQMAFPLSERGPGLIGAFLRRVLVCYSRSHFFAP